MAHWLRCEAAHQIAVHKKSTNKQIRDVVSAFGWLNDGSLSLSLFRSPLHSFIQFVISNYSNFDSTSAGDRFVSWFIDGSEICGKGALSLFPTKFILVETAALKWWESAELMVIRILKWLTAYQQRMSFWETSSGLIRKMKRIHKFGIVFIVN